jgi:hypothetical protein
MRRSMRERHPERRLGRRFALEGRVSLVGHGRERVARLQNLSVGGVSVALEAPWEWPLGAAVRVGVLVEDEDVLEARGWIARHVHSPDPTGLAIAFDRVPAELRRLIESLDKPDE